MPVSLWQASVMDDFDIDIVRSIDEAVDAVINAGFATRHAEI